MENLELKLSKERKNDNIKLVKMLPPIEQFMYFKVKGKKEEMNNIANHAFICSLQNETRKDILEDIFEHTSEDIDSQTVTSALCKHVNGYSWHYPLELAKKYNANMIDVEKAVLNKFSRISNDRLFSEVVSFVEEYDWSVTKNEKKQIFTEHYDYALKEGKKDYSQHSYGMAINALMCANLLKDDLKKYDASKIVFTHSLWRRDDLEENKIFKELLLPLKQTDKKMIIANMVDRKLNLGYIGDAQKIIHTYLPEYVDEINDIANTLYQY